MGEGMKSEEASGLLAIRTHIDGLPIKGSGFTGVQTSAHVIEFSLSIQVEALSVFLG